MDSNIFSGRKSIDINAHFVGQRIDLKALEQSRRVATSPFVMRVNENGYAVLFRYGAVALFGLNAIEETSFLKELEPFIVEPFSQTSSEAARVVIDPDKDDGIEPGYIHVKDWDMTRVQLIAEVLAKSAVLNYYETNLAMTFDRIEIIANQMQTGMPGWRRARDLMRHIGATLSIQRKMTGQVEIEEKPELLWDLPQLERFYLRLIDEYEITERHSSLGKKLDLIYRTAETMHSMIQERRTLHVEWYIVILILIEIAFTLSEKLF